MDDNWRIDRSHSFVLFSVRHLVISRVRGKFTRWRVDLRLDPDDPERSSVSVRIDARSIETGEPKRGEHLRSADFLDVEQHPEI